MSDQTIARSGPALVPTLAPKEARRARSGPALAPTEDRRARTDPALAPAEAPR